MSSSGKEASIDSPWSIQIPEDSSIVVEIAVRDLQKYLEKETKTKMELNRTKTVKPSNKVITVCANDSGNFKVPDLAG